MVFASFMMAYMCGSSTFDLLRGRGVQVMSMAQAAFGLGAFAFLSSGIAFKGSTDVGHLVVIYLGFIVFEFCCGLYFPSVSTIKGQAVPENIRSTVYNLYRVPMNAIVLAVLLTNISMTSVFIICFALLAGAGLSTTQFDDRVESEPLKASATANEYGSAA